MIARGKKIGNQKYQTKNQPFPFMSLDCLFVKIGIQKKKLFREGYNQEIASNLHNYKTNLHINCNCSKLFYKTMETKTNRI